MHSRISQPLVARFVATASLFFVVSQVQAVHTVADWTGQNTVTPAFALDNNYGIVSPTSVGGQIQSKVNFAGQFPTDEGQTINTHFVYLSDPTLDVPTPLNYASALHMEGTITFSAPMATEPNLLLGWYSSDDTTHRIGIGLSNLTAAQGGAAANRLRVDFGYAATGGNKFYFASDDGTADQANNNSVIPSGAYHFSFDYMPAASGVGGTMSTTVGAPGQYFRTITPLETQPWDLDTTEFDRFGLLQRSTTSTTQQGSYNVVFSNLTYTGGTTAAVAIPGDFDGDSIVDGDDLAIWKANYGTGTTVATGDADGDLDVDGADFLVWQRNLSTAPITAVPEPNAAVLLAAGALACLTSRRGRQC